MHTSRAGRRVLASAGIAAVCVVGAPATSRADGRPAGGSEVTVGTFADSKSFTDIVPGDYPCFGGVPGTITGSFSVQGRFNNAPGFFHAEGSYVDHYRIDFSDGRYAIGGANERFSFSANAGTPWLKDTHAVRETATVYRDGVAIGTVTFQSTFHATYVDVNGNGEADGGDAYRALVDRTRIVCG